MLFAFRTPIVAIVQNDRTTMFDISVDVIGEKLPVVIGAPAIKAMQSNINFESFNFSLTTGQSSTEFSLFMGEANVTLDLKS